MNRSPKQHYSRKELLRTSVSFRKSIYSNKMKINATTDLRFMILLKSLSKNTKNTVLFLLLRKWYQMSSRKLLSLSHISKEIKKLDIKKTPKRLKQP